MRTDFKALAQNIDNEILELLLKLAVKESRRVQLTGLLGRKNVTGVELTTYGSELSRVTQASNKLHDGIATLEAVRRMYGWNRAYIVSGGHVHNVQHGCPGFKYNTIAYLVPECSGLTEAEIVELAGERACTHCYPSAPLSVLQQASKLFAHDEQEKQRRAAEREVKRSAKDAAKLTVVLPNGEYGDGKPCTKTFGSVRGARNEASRVWESAVYYPGTSKGYVENFRVIVDAIAEREGLDVQKLSQEIQERVGKKYVREMQKPGIGFEAWTKAEALEELAKSLNVLASY